MSVKNTHKKYEKMMPKWQRCRDVTDGQDAMRERCYSNGVTRGIGHATNSYIPALKDQTEQDYRNYVNRAPFYNASWRTVAGLLGMLFRKPTDILVPTALVDILNDITSEGEPLQMFIKDVAEECLIVGRIGVLVDYPTVPFANATLADLKAAKVRPFLCDYKAESIINWRTRKIQNHEVLCQVVLIEHTEIMEDEFTEKCEKQYRVLDLDESDLYRVRMFRINPDTGEDEQIGPEIYPLMNGQRMSYIPFLFMSVDDITPDLDEPPLIDLVDMNIAHWQTTADYEHGCHYAGLPTPVISGYRPENEGEKLYIGSASAWVFPDPAAKATYLEFHGEGLKPLSENLAQKEQRMAVLGARMLEPQSRGVESAEAAGIHRSGESAMLADVANTISLGITQAMQWLANWAGVTGELRITVNDDFFPVPMDPAKLTSLVNAWQFGAISKETLFENLKQGEVITDTRTFEDEEAKIATASPTFAG